VATYRIVRNFANDPQRKQVIARGFTLQEARSHCNNPESSSRTCTLPALVRLTNHVGAWFDSSEEE